MKDQFHGVRSVNNFDFDILVESLKIKKKFHGLVEPPAAIFENGT